MNYPPYLKSCALFFFVGLASLLTACAAPQATTISSTSSTKLAHLNAGQQNIVDRLDQLQTNLLLLEARVMDQQKLIEKLRAAKITTEVITPQGISQPPSTNLTPAELYRKAFAAYAAGRYSEGLSEFKRFVSLFPTSEYAANASYWLAECHLEQKEYSQAASVYSNVAQKYARSAIAPKALWKEALALTRAGSEEEATEVLRTLQERYPDSSAAKKPLPAN